MSFRLKEIVACVSVDEQDEEGLMAFFSNGQWIPLIAGDAIRLPMIIEMAEVIKAQTGKDYRVVKFSTREDVSAQYKPQTDRSNG